MLRAVFFDVGETLVDEQRYWRAVADSAGLGPHVVWAALGMTIARNEEHSELWRHLGVDRPADAWESVVYSIDDLYPDALECLERLRAAGLLVGIAGNQTAALEAWARSSDNPVGGWYGLKKGLRGRFANYVPPVLEALDRVEVEHNPKNNRMRAR